MLVYFLIEKQLKSLYTKLMVVVIMLLDLYSKGMNLESWLGSSSSFCRAPSS